jgi:hypothetical protein
MNGRGIESASVKDDAKRLHPLIIFAIWLVPLLFGWLTLRRGHAKETRIAVLIYAVAPIVLGVIAAMASAAPIE